MLNNYHKQKNELESFRSDLHQLKQLKLEIKKKTLISNSTHSSPKHQSQHTINNSMNNTIHSSMNNSMNNSIDESYHTNDFKLNGNINGNIIPQRRNLHQHSSSSGAIQLDLITGITDEPKYILVFDPIDGKQNIQINASLGTIQINASLYQYQNPIELKKHLVKVMMVLLLVVVTLLLYYTSFKTN